MSKNINVPKLRFKEFSGEWVEKRFEDIFSFSIGKNIKQNEASPDFETPCVRYGELYHMYNEVISKVINKTNLDKSELLFSDGDEILMPSAGEDPLDIGLASALTLKYVAIGRTINILKPLKQNTYSQIFVSYYINSKLRKKISTLAKGSSISNVYNSDLKQLKAKLPTLEEQEKIASFLISIDKKIEKLTKKDELLQQYKKSIMQKIFSQEIRFKDDNGDEFAEWRKYRLNDFLILTLREIDKPKENYLAIGIRSHCKGTFQKPDSEPDKIAMDKLYVVKENDLIVNITFAWESAIAIVKKEDEGGLVSHRFPTYTFNKMITNSKYFKYVIIQKKFRIMLDLISPGGAGRNRVMSKKDFLTLKWELPCIEEQTNIANFLSSIDNKIEENQKLLEKTKEFKKALLQQMFI